MPGRFAETVGLDDSFDFFPGKNPDLGAGSRVQNNIAHIVHIARTRGRVGVQRLGV